MTNKQREGETATGRKGIQELSERQEDMKKSGKRIMSHLKDKNSTVAVIFLLRNTLRSQQVPVSQERRKIPQFLK